MKRYAGLESAVQNIVSVSKSVIANLEGGFYHTHLSTQKEPFSYSDKKLANIEIDFYTKCSTSQGVLNLHHQRITSALDECGPYTLFPVHSFSEKQLQGKFI